MAESTEVQPVEIGDWLVVPGPLNEHRWRWGRITGVLPGPDAVRYRVRWLGDVRDSVVLPAEGARVAKAADWPEPAGDAVGVWPGGWPPAPAGGGERPGRPAAGEES